MFKDNIHLLSGAIFPPDEVHHKVVNLLEDLLTRAQRGEIRGIGVAFVDGGGWPNTDWALGHSARDSHVLMSGVGTLLHRMHSLSGSPAASRIPEGG
jgi:hypothetical protein